MRRKRSENGFFLSVNQLAQSEQDTSANEAKRIRDREALVKRTWRTIAYHEGEAACRAERIADESELPVDYVKFICDNYGLTLH